MQTAASSTPGHFIGLHITCTHFSSAFRSNYKSGLCHWYMPCGLACLHSFANNNKISPQKCTTVAFDDIFLCFLQHLDKGWSGKPELECLPRLMREPAGKCVYHIPRFSESKHKKSITVQSLTFPFIFHSNIFWIVMALIKWPTLQNLLLF
jgi:hypothetical protein